MCDLDTYNKDRAVPCCSCIDKLSEISGNYNQDISAKECQKNLIDCVVFKGSDCNNEMVDHLLSFKGGAEKINTKIVDFNLNMIAHKGSDFDSYVVINNLPQSQIVVNLIKNGAGIISLNLFNGCVDEKKKFPQKVHFRSGTFQIISSSRKKGLS